MQRPPTPGAVMLFGFVHPVSQNFGAAGTSPLKVFALATAPNRDPPAGRQLRPFPTCEDICGGNDDRTQA